MTFEGVPIAVVTFTLLWARFVALVVTMAVPGVVWDARRTVPIPDEAFFVVVSSSVPGPDTVNVRRFVAVVTVLLPMSQTLEVIKAVALPSATMPVGSAVFMTFTGGPNAVVTAIVP